MYLHVVDSTSYGQSKVDKLFKIRPLLQAVQCKTEKVAKKEKLSIDKQRIPWKTKFSKARHCGNKKLKNELLRTWLWLGHQSSCTIFKVIVANKILGILTCKKLLKWDVSFFADRFDNKIYGLLL